MDCGKEVNLEWIPGDSGRSVAHKIEKSRQRTEGESLGKLVEWE